MQLRLPTTNEFTNNYYTEHPYKLFGYQFFDTIASLINYNIHLKISLSSFYISIQITNVSFTLKQKSICIVFNNSHYY